MRRMPLLVCRRLGGVHVLCYKDLGGVMYVSCEEWIGWALHTTYYNSIVTLTFRHYSIHVTSTRPAQDTSTNHFLSANTPRWDG